MLKFLVAYLSTAVLFLTADYFWLSYASRVFYRPRLGDLLSDSPNLTIAALFYLVYVIGIVVFAVMPARSLFMAIGLGALLGLVAYGTYDITNLATVRGWPVIVSIVDLAWGVCVTAVAATAGYLTLRTLHL